jgi:glutathione synthase/RimK-type ligase-like ATP-grasp enzyme
MEWGAVLDSVFSSSSIRAVSPLISQRAATKPRQLAAASEIGISIPATLITNDPAAALAFVEQYGRVIHKVMNEPTHRFLETKMWMDDDLARVGDIELAPIVLQELVVAPYEIRVTFVGDRLFAARVTAPQDSVVDSRLDRSRLFLPHVLPADVARDLRSLMAALGLSFGTIDLKLTESGEYVFLEVNPQGQFLYIEIMTGLPISTAVADYLVSVVK